MSPSTDIPSILIRRMHLLGQHLFGLFWDGLLRNLGNDTIARSVALGSGGSGVVDGVGDFLFDFLRQNFLELLGHDAIAYGVGLVGSLRHSDWIFGFWVLVDYS